MSTRVLPELPQELTERIVSHMQPNDAACNFRLVNKAAAALLRGPRHVTIHLSQPVPPHVFAKHWLAPGATNGLSLARRHLLLCLVAASGNVPNLEVALRASGCTLTWDVLRAAAAAGKLESCMWLHQQGCPTSACCNMPGRDARDVMAAAAANGHRHVCDWLMDLDLGWDLGAVEAAARGGHMSLMEWLQRRLQSWIDRNAPIWAGPDSREEQCRLAIAVAHGCDLPTLQRLWCSAWQQAGATGRVLAAAAGSPTPDWAAKVEWLERQGCPRTEEAAAEAAARPDALERLTWLRGRGYPLGKNAVISAAAAGNTPALQYILAETVSGELRPQSSGDAAIRAAMFGHLPALQALHAAGWALPRGEMCLAAAEGGHLDVVAWLVEAAGEEAPQLLNTQLAYSALRSDSVELLNWLRQRGCEWDAHAFYPAADEGCEEALEWLVAQGCPMPDDGMPYFAVLCNGDLATARCLRRLGLPWGADPHSVFMLAATRRAPPPLLRWLLEAGCPVDRKAAEAAVETELARPFVAAWTAEVLALLRQHRQEQDGHPAA